MKNSLSINNVSHFPQLVKRLWACHVLFLFSFSLSAQEVLNVTKLRYSIGTIGRTYSDPDYLYRSGDNFYFFMGAGDNYDELQFDIEVDSFPMPLDTFGNPITSTIMFEYKLGEGFTDYTFFNYANLFHDVSFDGNRMAFSLMDNVAGIDGNIFLGDVDSIANYDRQAGFVIYDLEADSIVYSFFSSVRENRNNDQGPSALFLDGDYIYVETRVDGDYTFLGKRVENIGTGVSRTSFLHKVNWKTNELLWTKQIGGLQAEKPIINMNVDSLGYINLVLKQWDQARYEKEVLDTLDIPGIDIVLYRLDPDGNLVNFDRYDHNSSFDLLYSTEFNPEGSLMIFGGLFNEFGETLVENNGDTIKTDIDHGVALIIKVKPNLERDWYKLYGGTAPNISFHTGFTENQDIITTFTLDDTLYIDNEVVVNSHNSEVNDDNRREIVIARLTNSGDLKSFFKFGTSILLIRNVYEIDSDHYLIMLENRGKEERIFDTSFGDDENHFDKYIIEIKGDIFDLLSAVEDTSSDEAFFTIYPNPTSEDYVTISDLPKIHSAKNGRAQIHDLQGNLIKESTITLGIGEVKLDVSMLNDGIYLVSIYDGEKKYTSKFIKY